MSGESPSDKRRLSTGATIKDDMNALYTMGDDAYAQLIKAVKNIQGLTEQINKVVTEVKGLKANDANVAAEVTILHDLAGTLSTDVDAMTQTVDGTRGEIKETARRQAEIMASVVETLMDVSDALESIKNAVIGLTQQLQTEAVCPWRDEEGATVFQSLEALVAMVPAIKQMAEGFGLLAPNIGTVVEVVLTKDHRDPKTGKKKEKWDIFVEKLAESLAAAVLSSIATGLLSVGVFIYFFGSKSAVEKARAETRKEQTDTIKKVEDEKTGLAQKVAEMEAEIAALQTAQKKSAPKSTK
jgi:cell division protein FtsB